MRTTSLITFANEFEQRNGEGRSWRPADIALRYQRPGAICHVD